MIAVSDSSPLHYLILIGYDSLLPALFGQVLIPPAVSAELSHPRAPAVVQAWIASSPPWLVPQQPSSIDPGLGLGAGEREAISLAMETVANFLLMDDRPGRPRSRVGWRPSAPSAFSKWLRTVG
jgi:predicted nucleic acid-binding protein